MGWSERSVSLNANRQCLRIAIPNTFSPMSVCVLDRSVCRGHERLVAASSKRLVVVFAFWDFAMLKLSTAFWGDRCNVLHMFATAHRNICVSVPSSQLVAKKNVECAVQCPPPLAHHPPAGSPREQLINPPLPLTACLQHAVQHAPMYGRAHASTCPSSHSRHLTGSRPSPWRPILGPSQGSLGCLSDNVALHACAPGLHGSLA